MAIYTYKVSYSVSDDQEVTLDMALPDPGTAAHHILDLPPGLTDMECVDSCSQRIGRGRELKVERTVLFTKVVNLDANNDTIHVDYFLNGERIVAHSNPKSIDPSPQLVVTISFE